MYLYKLSFKSTKKEYIGITTRSINLRFNQHINPNVKIKSLVQKAIAKHGNPKLEILSECDDWELLCLAEMEAIDKYGTFSPKGYNLTFGGDGAKGAKRSEEWKKGQSIRKLELIKSNPEKIKELQKRSEDYWAKESSRIAQSERVIAFRKNNPDHDDCRSKPVINSNGDIFRSVSHAARELEKYGYKKASQGTISMCLNGIRGSAYGMAWSFDTATIPIYTKKILGKSLLQVSTGIVFDSVISAVNHIKSTRGAAVSQGISKAARSGNTAYGSKWEYV